MEMIAKTTGVRISPRKVRLVADSIRNMPAKQALHMLSLVHKRGAYIVAKTLKSAIANAKQKADVSEENLVIATLQVTEGTFLKRFHASTRGRVHPYKRRSSHITITLKEVPHGTKN